MEDGTNKHAFNYAKGLLLALVAAILFTTSTVLAKILRPNYEVFFMVFMKFFFEDVFLMPLAAYYRKPYMTKLGDWPILIFRGFAGLGSISATYFAYQYISLGDVAVLGSLAPLWAMLFDRIFMKEPCQISNIVIMLICCSGVLFVVQPPFIFGTTYIGESIEDRLLGSGLALLSAIFSAAIGTATKKGVQTMHHVTLNFSQFTIITTVSFILTLTLGLFKYPPTYSERLLFVGMGLLSCAGSSVITCSVVYLPGNIVILIARGSSVVLSYILQILVLGKIPDLWSVIGASIITCSLLAIGGKGVMRMYYKDAELKNSNSFVRFVLKLR